MKLTIFIYKYKNMFIIKYDINNVNTPCARSHKRFWIHYGVRLKVAGNVFSVAFLSIMLNFSVFYDAHPV